MGEDRQGRVVAGHASRQIREPSLADALIPLVALAALALLSAAPFSVVMIGMMISVWKELSREVEVIEELELEIRQREYTQRYAHRITEHVESTVQAQVADKLGPAVAAEVEQRLQADGADRA